MTKSSNYRIRVEPSLHREFLDACRLDDKPAAQVIREFMKDYVVSHGSERQSDLFVAETKQTYSWDKSNG